MMRGAVLRFDPVDALKLVRKTVTISSDLDKYQPFVIKKYQFRKYAKASPELREHTQKRFEKVWQSSTKFKKICMQLRRDKFNTK